MDGIKFNSKGMSLDDKFFQDSKLSFYSTKKTIGKSVYNVHEALSEKYFIMKETCIRDKLMGEISHIITDLNLNPSLCYYPFFKEKEDKIYRLGKEIGLEVSNKSRWIEFLIDKESREFYGGFGLTLPKKYFLQNQ